MNDQEITKLCAEAIGWELFEEDGSLWEKAGLVVYDPLHDDAQAMALVKKFRILIGTDGGLWTAFIPSVGRSIKSDDLNRAICECVAKMMAK